jgi:hypothetical protein
MRYLGRAPIYRRRTTLDTSALVFVPVHIMVLRAIAMVGEPPVRKTSDCRMPARPHA